ncbi:hypothetical protein FACS1894153_4090 [Bacteroidia bacterium]|nr:hypothetical protein FACS1894153_4090 [Bacteroidia bacterium]
MKQNIIINNILRLIVNCLATAITLYWLTYIGFLASLIVAFVLALLNTYLKPLLMLFAVKLQGGQILLFLLCLNAILVVLACSIVDVPISFWRALGVTLISPIIGFLLRIPEMIRSNQIIFRKMRDFGSYNKNNDDRDHYDDGDIQDAEIVE